MYRNSVAPDTETNSNYCPADNIGDLVLAMCYVPVQMDRRIRHRHGIVARNLISLPRQALYRREGGVPMNSGNNGNTATSKCALMNKLRTLDFAIIETSLFLDTHPTDKKAMAYYKKTLEQRNALRKQYTELYGPLTIFENTSDTDWDWVKGPWPWELED